MSFWVSNAKSFPSSTLIKAIVIRIHALNRAVWDDSKERGETDQV